MLIGKFKGVSSTEIVRIFEKENIDEITEFIDQMDENYSEHLKQIISESLTSHLKITRVIYHPKFDINDSCIERIRNDFTTEMRRKKTTKKYTVAKRLCNYILK